MSNRRRARSDEQTRGGQATPPKGPSGGKRRQAPPHKPAPNDSVQEPPVRCEYARMEQIERLRPHPRNPKRHPAGQIALLAKCIERMGWRHPVIVNRDMVIVAGHARVEAARLLGLSHVPVDVQEFASEDEELALLLADNRIAELAETDDEVLRGLLVELQQKGVDMDLTGYSPQDVIAALEEISAEAEAAQDEPQQTEVCPTCGRPIRGRR